MNAIPTQEWFEMRDVRKRSLSTAVWLPLAASQVLSRSGEVGEVGYREEYFGSVSLAVPVARKLQAQQLEWSDLSGHDHTPEIGKDYYNQADIHNDYENELLGIRLVIKQHLNSQESDQWHLHQDLVVALHLKREGDDWVCPREGYEVVARLKRKSDGNPELLEFKSSHLRDYLCARNMGLFVTSFRSREAVRVSTIGITWPNNPQEEKTDTQQWEGHTRAISEGGFLGESMAYMHVGRKDIDMEEDVPNYGFPGDGDVVMNSWTREASKEPKIFFIAGELWRNDWVDPAQSSPRVREDETPGTVYFVTDAVGTRETKETMGRESRWLWFKPQIINELTHYRGGSLVWYTRETGKVGATPDHRVHFGVNKLGLVNVYAKDIAELPDWEQQIWAGQSISIDGGVSQELMKSQMQAIPAETQAPEEFLKRGLDLLNSLTQKAFDFQLFKPHADYDDILTKVHRFRALNRTGLFALAKDVARLTADSIDAASIQKHVVPPKGEKWGSLKSLEKLLATKVDPTAARALLTPLAGTYDLRLADAHLPSSKTDDALKLVRIDEALPFVWQGAQLLSACVNSLYQIAEVFQREFIDAPAPPQDSSTTSETT